MPVLMRLELPMEDPWIRDHLILEKAKQDPQQMVDPSTPELKADKKPEEIFGLK
jgi:hypothetical protein